MRTAGPWHCSQPRGKVKGTITGGTDTALVGGTLKRKTCVYQGSGTFFIRLFPGTVAKY
jgi:hypothetical protein